MKPVAILVCASLCAAATARAEPAATDDPPATALDWWSIPAPRTAVARVVAEAGLRRSRAWAPVTLAPDLAIGLDDRFGVMVHSSRGSEARLGAGNGVCVVPPNETLGMATSACPSLDQGFGVTGLARLARRADTVARVGVIARDWSPLALALEVGTSSTARAGRVWAQAAPTIVVGLSERGAGNRDRVQLPIYVGVSPRPRAELHLRTGLDATLETFADTWVIPIGAGASIQMASVRVGADVTLDKAIGPLNATYWRSASVYVQTAVGSW